MNKISLLFILFLLSLGVAQSQSYNISNSSISACSGTFYDNGGTGNYTNNRDITFTICPSTSGLSVQAAFSAFQLESGYDYLYIYNGNSTSAPLIGTYSGTTSPGTIISSASNGCLTFRFTSDGSVTYSGWVAALSCVTPPPPSTNVVMTTGSATACTGTFYDSGITGSYSNNLNQTFTICPSTPGARLNVNFSSFALESSYDYLTIYDGNSTSAASLGTFTGSVGPGNISASVNNASGCLTFRFTSDGSVTYAGWVAAISCILPCQTITSNFISSNPAPQSDGIIRVCQGQSVSFSGNGTFSSSGTGANYSWSMGNGTSVSGQNASYAYTSSGAYVVNLNITDPTGCANSNQINKIVQVSTTPTISTTATPTTICQGQSSSLTASVTPTPFIQNCTPPISGTTFLPDGSGASYSTAITVNCYTSSQTVQSTTDIQNICLNMEHSFMGDLQIKIICPNGQSSILKAYPGGSGTYLGCPIDNTTGGPGSGRNYCFTPTASTLLVNGPTSNCGSPSSASINAGNYAPAQSFTNLIGCPLNGAWTIQVTDNLSADDGYIFSWDINFNSTLAPASGSFTPTIVSQGWTTNSTLTSTGATTATVAPTTLGSNCYSYSVTDNFGCVYNQNQCITVTNGSTPTFTQLGPYCQGETAGALPTTSTNGITGTWSPSTISTATAGTTVYTFTPSASQCAIPTTMSVDVSIPPSVSVNSVTICSGETTTLTATPTNSGGTYSWSTGATTNTITIAPTATTTYTVTYSSGSCTPSIATGTVTVNPAPVVTIASITICSGETGTLTSSTTIIGGAYSWSTGATSTSITDAPTTTTNYTLTYSFGSCTPSVATGTITVTPAPVVTIASITICSGETGTLTATPDITGGTYVWSTGVTTSSISDAPTSTTNYTVTYSLGGCTPAIANATITVNPAPTLTVNSLTLCSGVAGTLTAVPSQIGGTFLWSTNETTDAISVTPTVTTSYTVTYSLGGCTPATATATVTVNPTPVISVNNDTICSGNSTTLTVVSSPLGGNYSWSDGSTTSSITVNPTTTTTYTVTYDLTNCIATATSVVVVNQTPTLSVNSETICSGTSATLTATPSQTGGDFLWTPGGDITSTLTVSPTTTTTYTVDYSLLGCPALPATATVTVNPTPVISVNSDTICTGNSTTLTVVSSPLGGSYSWSDGSTTSSITVSPTTTTAYTVTYDLTNCIATATSIVVVNQTPTVTVNSETICSGTSTILTATPSQTGGTFLWTPGGATTSTLTVTPTSTTTYTLDYSISGCPAIPVTATVTVNPTPVISVNSDTICTGNSATLTVVSSPLGGNYSWSNGATTSSITVSPTTTTTYTISYDLTNCIATATSIVVVNQTPTVTVSGTTICSGTSATLTATPSQTGGTYLWTPGGATTSTLTVSPTTTTTYTLDYSISGCPAIPATATVTVNPTPVISVNSPTICSGSSTNLTVTNSLTGGVYTWSPGGQTTASINVNPMTTSTYTVTYTQNGCSANATSTVTVNPTPTITVTSATICNGQSATITASATPTGGSYLWSNNQSTPSITVTPTTTTTYNVLYILNGCNVTGSSTVTVNPVPTITINTATICAGETAALTASPNLPNGTILWNPTNETTETINVSPMTTSTYSAVYTLNNCPSSSVSAIVTVKPVPVVTVNNATICSGQTANILATPSITGGTFVWTPNVGTTNSINVSPTSTSNYSVQYTLNGCLSIPVSATVTVNATPVISFQADKLTGCVPLTVQLVNTTNSSFATSNCAWTLSNGAQLSGCDTISYTFNSAGCFDLTLTASANGCVGSTSQSSYICVDDVPSASFFTNPGSFTEPSQALSFINNSVGGVTYNWDFGDGSESVEFSPSHNFSNTTNGYVVHLTATSDLGCIGEYEKPILYNEPDIYYIPNTFTPDGDEHNQIFQPILTSGVDPHNFLMQIYNRWGELIFETYDPNWGWDGSVNKQGKDAPQGTYAYKIVFKNPHIDKRITLTGHVNLLR
jgi:gliding motility-associated-like protein